MLLRPLVPRPPLPPPEPCPSIAKEFSLTTVALLLHDRLATSVLIFMVVAGTWGLVSFFRGGTLSGSLAGTFVIGQVLIVVQSIAGVILYLNRARPPDATHYLYGATMLVVLPFVWSYVRERNPRQGLLFYSLVALFIAGLAIRGMTTGR